MDDAFATMEQNELRSSSDNFAIFTGHTRRIIFAEQLCCRLLSTSPP
jgi:hypothetical protein